MSRGRELAHVATVIGREGHHRRARDGLHNNTAAALPWGNALLGGPLTVIATPVGHSNLVSLKTSTTDWAGVGVIAGHVWNDIPAGADTSR